VLGTPCLYKLNRSGALMTRVDLQGVGSIGIVVVYGVFYAGASTAGDGWSVCVRLSGTSASFRWDRLLRYSEPLLCIW